MLNMVLKGTICFRCPETPPTFTLILDLDVDLILEKPKGLMVTDLSQGLATPAGFEALHIPSVIAVPGNVIVEETEQPPIIPLGFHAEDMDYVAVPQGFLVEDI